MKEDNPFITKSSRIVYQNRWIKVHEDQIVHPANDGKIYAYIETRDSVMIVPFDEKSGIYLIKAFRYPSKTWSWELPGGGGEDLEKFIETSKRELAEETGIVADQWDDLGATAVWNGLATEQQHNLLARGLTFRSKPKSDDEALVRDGRWFALDEIRGMIASGEINDNQSLAALYLAELFLGKLNKVKGI
jgi:8-oxo-dGTP pyrophosphatase MutT (NUDIX family)